MSETNIAIRFSRKPNGRVLATLAGQDESLAALAIEKDDAETAAAELVKLYFTLYPLVEAEPASKPQRTVYSKPAIKALLDDAIVSGDVVRLSYTDAMGNTTTRNFQPESWVNSDTGVFGYDQLRGAVRTLRLDRIQWAA